MLAAKNRHLYEQIQQRQIEEKQAIEHLKAEPVESLTAQQQLFRRLCTLMADQHPYTDEGLNRDGLAQLLGTNAKYIDQAIHDCSHGETTGNFINRYRMEQAAHLLKTTGPDTALCATGGFARWAIEGSDLPYRVEPDLTLFGLGVIHDFN